jgi:hypothetical protein
MNILAQTLYLGHLDGPQEKKSTFSKMIQKTVITFHYFMESISLNKTA